MNKKISETDVIKITSIFGEKTKINPRVLHAIIEVESSYYVNAVRFEPRWAYPFQVKDFARKLQITQDTERVMQSCSWGLMQIMGTCAREQKYERELHLTCDPYTNVELGSEKLAEMLNKYQTIENAVAAYNAGYPRKTADGKYKNQKYVDDVFKTYDSFY
jgi:soluble lytic murein transglycosylase-like protein